MERRIKEENITKAIIFWLENQGWKIICFDFPQSGTGRILHPNDREGFKNINSIIPDIVAIKNKVVVFFENKDRFFLSDFYKLESLKNSDKYSKSIGQLLKKYKYTNIYYGIGLPISERNKHKVKDNEFRIDFIIDSNGNFVKINYQVKKIFA